jgi:hypothetical protein
MPKIEVFPVKFRDKREFDVGDGFRRTASATIIRRINTRKLAGPVPTHERLGPDDGENRQD